MTSNDQEWVTLQEASKITGKSVNAIRLMVKRLTKGDQPIKAKKVQQNAREQWVLWRGDLNKLSSQPVNDHVFDNDGHMIRSKAGHATNVPVEMYETLRKERDSLFQGMLMYQFKFEDLDRKMKCLPAPAEVLSSKLEEQEKELALLRDEKAKAEHLTRENEAMKSRIREMELPWWKRLFKPRTNSFLP